MKSTTWIFWIFENFCNLPYHIVGKEYANIHSTDYQNWSRQAFCSIFKASEDCEEHQSKIQDDKEDTETKPLWIEAMFKVVNRMVHKNWKIMPKATFESTIVVAVNGNVEDSTQVEDTENEVKNCLP